MNSFFYLTTSMHDMMDYYFRNGSISSFDSLDTVSEGSGSTEIWWNVEKKVLVTIISV